MKSARYIVFLLCFLVGAIMINPVVAITPEDESEEVLTEDEAEEEDEETYTNKELIISAVNAGPKEMIELFRLKDAPISLQGISIYYQNSGGTVNKPIYEFEDGLTMIGESVLLRLKSTDESEKADLSYSSPNMAQAGGRVYLLLNGEEIDSVCWGNFPECEGGEAINTKFLVRDFETLKSVYLDNYEPVWEEGRIVFLEEEEGNGGNEENEDGENEGEDEKEKVCFGLEFSELLTYFEADKSEQYIELYNSGTEKINLENCYLRYKNKAFRFNGEVEPDSYYVFRPTDYSLTKNPTKSNLLEIVDGEGEVYDSLTYYNGQKKGVALARFFENNEAIWKQTYSLTPGEENVFQESKITRADETEEEEKTETAEPVCRGLQFSEIFTYYETEKSEQFIELFNSSSNAISLKGCSLRYKNKLYPLEGRVVAEGFFVYFPSGFSLTKNPVNSNLVEIIDADGSVVDSLVYYNGQKKGVSLAQFGFKKDGSEQWLQTFSPTPGDDNNYQKYKTCPEGKVINEETGNCVKTISLSTSLKECPAGYYRNPLTNRCKKYTTSSSSLKECAEGYERNPLTNRCRKIVKNDGAEYEVLEEKFEEKSSFVAVWAIVTVGVIGAIYVLFEYRKELAGVFRKKK